MKKALNVYALSLYARCSEYTEHTAAWTIATSDTEAIGYGLAAAKKKWPVHLGFGNHSAIPMLIPDKVVRGGK